LSCDWLVSRLMWCDVYLFHTPDCSTSLLEVGLGGQFSISHLVCDPTIRQPGIDLPQQQWSLLNRFRTEEGHCGACTRKWRLTDTDLCPCGETQTMSHIVESCPLTKLNGGLFRLHSVDEDAVSWLTSYGSWHAYEKKIDLLCTCFTHLPVVLCYWPVPYLFHTPACSTSLLTCAEICIWMFLMWYFICIMQPCLFSFKLHCVVLENAITVLCCYVVNVTK